MTRRIALMAFAAVMLLCIAVIGAGFAFLHLPALEQQQSRIAVSLLSSYVGEPVEHRVPGAAALVVADAIKLPFHLLGSILGADGRLPPEHRPCVAVPSAK